MKPSSIVAAVLWSAPLVFAQAAPGRGAVQAEPGKAVEPVTTTVTHDSTGVTLVRVKNNAAVDLTGFLFIYTLQRTADGPAYGATNGYYDSATDSYASAVPAGQEILLPFRIGGNGFFAKVSAGAAIFADGTTFGQKATVQRILDRRNYMLVTLNKSIADLLDYSKQGLTRERVIAQFQTALNEETAMVETPDLSSCIQVVRGEVIATLRSARQPDGSTTPLATLIQSLVERLKARRDLLKKALG